MYTVQKDRARLTERGRRRVRWLHEKEKTTEDYMKQEAQGGKTQVCKHRLLTEVTVVTSVIIAFMQKVCNLNILE